MNRRIIPWGSVAVHAGRVIIRTTKHFRLRIDEVKPSETVTVVGGGLAGSEAAWQIARRGVAVRLLEMRPVRPTPVHRTDRLAELVCSNSLKSVELTTPHGLLKEEMTRLGSLVVEQAHAARVPAGAALAVDRDMFAEGVTRALESEPRVTIVREEAEEIPGDPGPVVLATSE